MIGSPSLIVRHGFAAGLGTVAVPVDLDGDCAWVSGV